jgi:thioredoxin 1
MKHENAGISRAEVGMMIKRRLHPMIAALTLGAILVLASCQGDDTSETADDTDLAQEEFAVSKDEPLPKLVDLGKGTCIPCKKMKPILEELTVEYEGRAVIEYIDLRYHPEAGREYGIRLIPTQIFFDPEGNEVFRHEGFMDKETIVAKFREMGVL